MGWNSMELVYFVRSQSFTIIYNHLQSFTIIYVHFLNFHEFPVYGSQCIAVNSNCRLRRQVLKSELARGRQAFGDLCRSVQHDVCHGTSQAAPLQAVDEVLHRQVDPPSLGHLMIFDGIRTFTLLEAC